jgi:hypothetical protein
MSSAIKEKFGLFTYLTICVAPSLVWTAGAVSQETATSPDAKTVWHDCRQIGVEGKGWTDTQSFYDRLPMRAQGKLPDHDWSMSHYSTGMVVHFTTNAPSIQVRWTLVYSNLAMPHMPATGVSGVDLYARQKTGLWRFVGNGRPTGPSNAATFASLPGQEHMLYLPLYNGVKSVEIGVPPQYTISRNNKSTSAYRKPIVFYGQSITQGGCASRPGMAWTAIVGRRLDVPIINLGFSGSGKMEPGWADLLADLDPAVYVLNCLENMKPEQVSERLELFVRRLRQARPTTAILILEDVSIGNVCPTEKGKIARAICAKLTAEGVADLHFLSNEEMLGDDGEGTVDGSHPNDLGMMRYATAIAKELKPYYILPAHKEPSSDQGP